MPLRPQKSKDLLTIKKILKCLPHRYPFLLVDRVLKLEKGKCITAIKNVSYNEHFFQGHFPHLKVMPGVLVVEALAQTGGILLYHSAPNPETILVFLTAINNAKFRKPIVPGDQLKLEVEILKLKSKYSYISGKAFVDGELVAECKIMASFSKLEELNERE